LQRGAEAAKSAYISPSTLACRHVGLGDWTAAFEWLDQAIEGRDPLIMPIKVFPLLELVRGDARSIRPAGLLAALSPVRS